MVIRKFLESLGLDPEVFDARDRVEDVQKAELTPQGSEAVESVIPKKAAEGTSKKSPFQLI